MSTKSKKQLWVLGAGRLNDIDLINYERLFDHIALFDADPLALPIWQRQQKLLGSSCRMSFHIEEATGTLAKWIEQTSVELQSLVKKHKKSARPQAWPSIMTFVSQLPISTPPGKSRFMDLPKPDAVLSLNLLSQIPLFWQDWLKRTLIRYFGRDWAQKHEEEWLAAYRPSAQRLIEQHLEDLNTSGAKQVLLISDLEFCRYYNTSAFSRSKWQPEPCVWTEEEGWKVAQPYSNGSGPLEIEIIPALYGVKILNEKLEASLLSNYRCNYTKHWTWHIAPLGIEDKKRGELHHVATFAMELRD